MAGQPRCGECEEQPSGINCASLNPAHVQVRRRGTLFSLTPVRSRPVNPPAFSGHGSPEEPFVRRLSRMVVENGGAFVESSRVPRIAELEQVVIEMVTELVAQGAQKCPKRCDFFLSRSSHPQPYEHRRGVIVAE